MSNSNVRPWLSKAEVAHELGLHERTVSRMIDAGTLRAYRVASRVRIKRTDAEALAQPIPAGQGA